MQHSMIIQNELKDKNCSQIRTQQQPLNIPSNMADIFALGTLGMMFGGNRTTDYNKLGETLKRAVTNKGSDNDIVELATALNLPAHKVQEAINKVKEQLKN